MLGVMDISVHCVWAQSHEGIMENEMADKTAREALNLSQINKQQLLLTMSHSFSY